MSEESFLDELADSGAPQAEETQTEEPTQEAAPKSEAGEQAEASPPDADEGESAKQELSDKEKAFLRKAEDEARKRQEAELELARLQGRLESTQTPKAEESPEDADARFWDSPTAIMTAREQKLMETFKTERLKDRIAMSEHVVKAQHKDASEMFEAFQDLVKENPAMGQAFREHPAPAFFAYDTGKTYLQTKDIKDLDSLKAKLRDEVREELKKEMAIETAKGAPPSNAGTRESGAAAAPDQSVDDALGEMVAP